MPDASEREERGRQPTDTLSDHSFGDTGDCEQSQTPHGMKLSLTEQHRYVRVYG